MTDRECSPNNYPLFVLKHNIIIVVALEYGRRDLKVGKSVQYDEYINCQSFPYVALKIRDNFRVYLERAHQAFLTTLVVLVLPKHD